MELKMYAVRDDAIKTFMQPFFTNHEAIAVRSFTDTINNEAPDNSFHHHKEDFSLWFLGIYDDQTGTFTQESGPEKILMGINVQPKED